MVINVELVANIRFMKRIIAAWLLLAWRLAVSKRKANYR